MIKKKFLYKAVFFLILTVIIYFFYKEIGLKEYIDPEFVRQKIEDYGVYGPIIFIFVYILATILLLPASAFTVLAGAVFGPLYGSIYVVIAATIGSFISFFLARYFFRYFAKKILEKYGGRLSMYDDKFRDNGFWTMIFFRLVPIVPFSAFNFSAGITSVRKKDFFFGTLIGIIPGTFAYAYLGESIFMLDFQSLVFAVLLIFGLGIFIYLLRKNRRLLKNEYDLIVIGAGAAGLNVAGFMNKAGFKVLLIERDKHKIGGDCLNNGCVPSKALIHVSKLIRDSKKAENFGLNVKGELNLEKVFSYINQVKETIREYENYDYLKNKGLDLEIGEASFVSSRELEVNSKKYWGKKIVIATGSTPRRLDVKGIEKINLLYSEDIFELKKVPKRFLVIGGGPIGVEIAQAYSGFGCKVAIVHRGKEILNKEMDEASRIISENLKKEGVKLYLESEVKEFMDDNTAILKTRKKEIKVNFDVVFVAIGRVLDFSSLKVKKADILMRDGKIIVDDYLRTSNRNVLVSGDAVGSYQFTHASELHASVILNNFFSPFKKRIDYSNFGWVTFTYPEIATFGLDEKVLKKRKIHYTVLKDDFSRDDRAIVDDYPKSYSKLFVSRKNKLLGGTIIAPNAGEIIQELILLKTLNVKVDKLIEKIYPYPTKTRINKKIIAEHLGKSLTRGGARKVLKFLFRLK